MLPSLLRQQGPRWILFRLAYAGKLRTRWFERSLPIAEWSAAPAAQKLADIRLVRADDAAPPLGSAQAVVDAQRILAGTHRWFSKHESKAGFPPDWSATPCAQPAGPRERHHWSRINDFSAGDIKAVWELGRFGFVFPLVRAYAFTGDERYADTFWQAAEDWREKNPPQCGAHWKCGQEIALRLMTWTLAYSAFRKAAATTPQRQAALAEMVDHFGRRIELNIAYALHQKNNHGVSEAAGLFTAGVLLSRRVWITRGRRLLERLARELIYSDGSFSQHSTNYHRLMLHVYLWALQLGRAAGWPLSGDTVERLGKAGWWLRTLLVDTTGRVPNLGANDGAHFLDLTDLGYLDYRPTVQAVGVVTNGQRWLSAGPWDELAQWLGADAVGDSLDKADQRITAKTPAPVTDFADGGYVVWRDADRLALLRCPRRFRHRPSQCDLLHFDLWHRDHNLLRDAGTYSYHCDEPWQSYFGSSAAHNTIRFDDRDPMPRISRFLYGKWPRCHVTCDGGAVTARYQDQGGAEHRRTVLPQPSGFRIEDEVSGRFRKATLRWRLCPDLAWTRSENGCSSSMADVTVQLAEKKSVDYRIADGWDSLYYWEKKPLPVLEVPLGAGARSVVTEIRLK